MGIEFIKSTYSQWIIVLGQKNKNDNLLKVLPCKKNFHRKKILLLPPSLNLLSYLKCGLMGLIAIN